MKVRKFNFIVFGKGVNKKHSLSTYKLFFSCMLCMSISVAMNASAAEAFPKAGLSSLLASCQRDLGMGVNVQAIPEYTSGKLMSAVLMVRYFGLNAPKINPSKIELSSLPDGKVITPIRVEKRLSDVANKVVDEKYFDSIKFLLPNTAQRIENIAFVFLEGALKSGQEDIGKTTNIRFSNSEKNSQNGRIAEISPCRVGLEGWKPKEPLQQRLHSKDNVIGKEAAIELLKNADTAEPMSLMMAAYQLSVAGNANAGFWFYASNLRADYIAVSASSQYKGLFIPAIRPAIDAKAMLDIPKMTAMLDKVLEWEEKTFESWCLENDLSSSDETLQLRRKAARKNFVEFRKNLTENKEKYEKQARDYKSPEQYTREKDAERAKDIGENYTTVDIERAVGEHLLKVPSNYLSPMGKRLSEKDYPNELTITIFLPSLSGYTKENWQYLGKAEGGLFDDRMNVYVVHKRRNSTNHDADGENAERLFDEFIVSNPPKVEYLGQEFFLYDYQNTKLSLPTHLSDVYYIAGDNQTRDSLYLMCHVNSYIRPNTLTRCEVFFLDHATRIYMKAYLPPKHFYLWKEIRLTFKGLLEKWLIK